MFKVTESYDNNKSYHENSTLDNSVLKEKNDREK